MRFLLRVGSVACALTAGVTSTSFAQQSGPLTCPPGHAYVEREEGRGQLCVLELPGFLKVQDGPSRWYFSPGGFVVEEGTYRLGRKIGKWHECDRFSRCEDRTYEMLYPNEHALGLQPVIPVTFANRKYVFDFGSCWATLVARQTTDSYVELNVGRSGERCQITVIRSANPKGPDNGNDYYLCEVPVRVGVRTFDSVDLRAELPRAGLPQFCRQNEQPPTVPAPDGLAAQGFTTSGTTNLVTATGNVRVAEQLANSVDVICASIEPRSTGPALLTVRFNEFAERIVLDHMNSEAVTAASCTHRTPLSVVDKQQDPAGYWLFRYSLNPSAAIAARQRACITMQVTLAPTCASR